MESGRGIFDKAGNKTWNWAALFHVVAHLAVWTPFLTAVAESTRGNWRVIGDGAAIAMRSWHVMTQLPLVGQPTELGTGLHDLGPLQYWMLAVPVHIDPVRGVLWGAALWCMAAASLAIEAAWSVLGHSGGLLASGTILAMIAWSPGLAAKPYWNPCFGMMYFLAALAAAWAVMAGRRSWWPALVFTASVATQAHLMFAIASVLLVLLALITGLADEFREKKRYWWAVTGCIAGLACWAAPLYQQFTSHPGNLTALLQNQAAGQRTGLVIALKSLTATSLPPPFWWPYPQQPQRTAAVIDSRPAVFAVVILAGVTLALLGAVFPLRSRALARLAAVSLLTSGAALVTFSHIPMLGDYRGRLSYLMMVMVAAGLLDWITIGLALVLAGQQMVSRLRATAGLAEPPGGHHRPARAGTRWARPAAGAAAVVLIALAAVPGLLQPLPSYPGDPRRAELVSAAARLIEERLPPQPMTESVVAASVRDERRVSVGLKWALMGDGYRMGRTKVPPGTPITKVTVFLQDNRITAIVVAAHQRAAASPACRATPGR